MGIKPTAFNDALSTILTPAEFEKAEDIAPTADGSVDAPADGEIDCFEAASPKTRGALPKTVDMRKLLAQAKLSPIRGNVGKGQANDNADVAVITRMLAFAGFDAKGDLVGAIKRFQAKNGIPSDGWIGVTSKDGRVGATLEKLISKAAAARSMVTLSPEALAERMLTEVNKPSNDAGQAVVLGEVETKALLAKIARLPESQADAVRAELAKKPMLTVPADALGAANKELMASLLNAAQTAVGDTTVTRYDVRPNADNSGYEVWIQCDDVEAVASKLPAQIGGLPVHIVSL